MAEVQTLELNLGKRCNCRCLFCISAEERDRRGRWAPLARMVRELRGHRCRGFTALSLLGGEPTVYPHILDCLRTAQNLGYTRISLCTNGARLADAAFARRLVEAGLTRCGLSIHSHQARVESRLTGVPGILAKKMQAIRNLVALREQKFLPDGVSANAVLCRDNYGGMIGYVRTFAQLGIRDIRFNFIWPNARVRHANRQIVPQYREVLPQVLEVILRNRRRPRIRLSFGDIPPCVLPAPLHRWPKFVAGFFLEPGLHRGIRVSAFRSQHCVFERSDFKESGSPHYKIKLPACASCRYGAVCDGIYVYYLELYGRSEFNPIR
jgi:MoaA/NifB/PqqE/SkfB family radical SAM enzyme